MFRSMWSPLFDQCVKVNSIQHSPQSKAQSKEFEEFVWCERARAVAVSHCRYSLQ